MKAAEPRRLVPFVVAGLHACQPGAPRTLPANPDVGLAPSRASATPASLPASTPAPKSAESAACGLDAELAAMTQLAEDPHRAAAELRRQLLSPAQAREFAGKAAEVAVSALARGSYSDLADLIDPSRGLCLRPAKGADCRQMSSQELRACGEAKRPERWDVDDGSDEGPSYTCREAFARIFYARDFRHPSAVRYNCFPELGRGNNSDTILSAPLHRAYVEYFADEPQAVREGEFPRPWRSLWLVFDGRPEQPRLVELIAEYWGI